MFELRARGLIKGGTVGVALIGYGWGWYEADIVHFEDDEPARHRIIDLTVRPSVFHQSLQLVRVP